MKKLVKVQEPVLPAIMGGAFFSAPTGSRNRAGPAVQQISRLTTEANRNPFLHPFSDVAHRPESREIGSNFCWPTSG